MYYEKIGISSSVEYHTSNMTSAEFRIREILKECAIAPRKREEILDLIEEIKTYQLKVVKAAFKDIIEHRKESNEERER